MADTCEGIKEEVKVSNSRYSSDWFDPENQFDRGRAIRRILGQMGLKIKPCKGDCDNDPSAEHDRTCMPYELDIEVPEGKGKFEKIDDPDPDSRYISYLLKIKEDKTKITIKTKCSCQLTNKD